MKSYTKQKTSIEEKRKLYKSKKICQLRFKKGELIGEGSYGKVYQGFDEEQGRLIAIKEIDIGKINKKNLMVSRYRK